MVLDAIVNYKLEESFPKNHTASNEIQSEIQKLMETYNRYQEEINDEEQKKEELRADLENDLIEKFNNFISKTQYGGSDLRDYVSNFVDNISQFKKVWGKKLNDKCKNAEPGDYVATCYLCQQIFNGKAPGYSVEMEHKLPLTFFNSQVPSFTYFPIEMKYWTKFIKLKHVIPTLVQSLNFKPLQNEPFIEYIYRFINCQYASTYNWCDNVNILLENFIDVTFGKFFLDSLDKIGVRGGQTAYLANTSNRIKY